MKFKRFIAALTLFFFTTQALAIVFLPALGVLIAGTQISLSAGAAGATAMTVSLLEAVTVHAAIGALYWDNKDKTSNDNNSSPLTVNLQPNVQLPVPPGWSYHQGNQQPDPPNNIPIQTFTMATKPVYPTQVTSDQAAAQNYLDYVKTLAGAGGGTISSVTRNANNNQVLVTIVNTPYSFNNAVAAYLEPGCPTGYGLSGQAPNQTCAVLNAQVVMKPADQKCTIIRTGNTFTPDSRDPDCSSAELLAAGIDASDPTHLVIKPKGSNIKTDITINPDGSSQIQNKTDLPNGNTKVDTVTLDPPVGDGAPLVKGKKSEEFAGQGDQQSPTPLGTTGTTTVNFDKTGLATTANQTIQHSKTDLTNSHLDTIKTDVTTIKDAITNADNNPTDLADKKTEFDTIAQAHSDAVKAIGDGGLDNHGFSWNWSISVPAGTCTPFSHSFGGHAITMDYCAGVYAARDFAAWLFYIFTGMTLTSIVTRRPD